MPPPLHSFPCPCGDRAGDPCLGSLRYIDIASELPVLILPFSITVFITLALCASSKT